MLAVLVVAVPIAGIYLYDERSPDYWVERAYIVSQMSEEAIRKVRLESDAEYDRDYARDLDNQKAERAEMYARMSRCGDIGFREKNRGACSLPLGWAQEIIPLMGETRDQRFERELMGVCAIVTTVREAKRFKCLPPS